MHWRREKSQPAARARLLASTVFPTPGHVLDHHVAARQERHDARLEAGPGGAQAASRRRRRARRRPTWRPPARRLGAARGRRAARSAEGRTMRGAPETRLRSYAVRQQGQHRVEDALGAGLLAHARQRFLAVRADDRDLRSAASRSPTPVARDVVVDHQVQALALALGAGALEARRRRARRRSRPAPGAPGAPRGRRGCRRSAPGRAPARPLPTLSIFPSRGAPGPEVGHGGGHHQDVAGGEGRAGRARAGRPRSGPRRTGCPGGGAARRSRRAR